MMTSNFPRELRSKERMSHWIHCACSRPQGRESFRPGAYSKRNKTEG